MAKNLETVDAPALECILKYLEHPDKLNLRETSRSLYERVTELDNTFKFWTFDLFSKLDLPKFVLESDKSFKIHIKYPTSHSNEAGGGESGDEKSDDEESDDDESDEHEMEEEMVEKLKEFIEEYSARIVSFTLSSNDYSEGFFSSLLEEIMIGEQRWENFKTLKICNKIKDKHKADIPLYCRQFLTLEISDAFFKSCQNSLETMEFEGVQFSFRKGLRFWNLKTLVLDFCINADEFLRSVAPRLEVLKINMLPNTLRSMIEGNFTKLRVLEINWAHKTNLHICHDDILSSCHLTIEHLWIEPTFNDLDLSKLDVDFPKLKSIRLGTGVQGVENLLNRCSSSLQKLFYEAENLNFSKLKNIYPKLKSITILKLKKKTSKLCIVEFLNRCPTLEFLHIDLNDMEWCQWQDQIIYSPWEDQVELKIENLPLKQLSCPVYFLEALSVSSCQHISQLSLADLTTISTLKGLKFPALNILRGCDDNSEVQVKAITDLLFEDVQWMKREETKMYSVGTIYERAYIPDQLNMNN